MPLPQSIAEVKSFQQPHDSIFSRLIYRRISKYCTYTLLKVFPRIAAPDVTIISFAVGLVGVVGLLSPAWWGRLLAFVAIQLSFALDCSDGEVARMLSRGSKFGIWFDSISDRTKEILWLMALSLQLYWYAPVALDAAHWQVLLTGQVGHSPWIIYLGFTAALANTLVGYLREAKKSIFLTQRKPEIILRPGLHVGTVDVITFLLSWGALLGIPYVILLIIALPQPLLLLKQLISTYRQSNKPNRSADWPLTSAGTDD